MRGFVNFTERDFSALDKVRSSARKYGCEVEIEMFDGFEDQAEDTEIITYKPLEIIRNLASNGDIEKYRMLGESIRLTLIKDKKEIGEIGVSSSEREILYKVSNIDGLSYEAKEFLLSNTVYNFEQTFCIRQNSLSKWCKGFGDEKPRRLNEREFVSNKDILMYFENLTNEYFAKKQ